MKMTVEFLCTRNKHILAEKTEHPKTDRLLMNKAYACPNCKRQTSIILGVIVCSCGFTRTINSKTETSVPNSLPPSLTKRKHKAKTRAEVFETIAKVCESLRLTATIRDRAMENYRKLIGKKATKGRKHNALLAACIDIACEQEGDKRTLKEICSVSVGITIKELAHAKMGIKEEYKHMGEKMEMKPVSSAQCMRRYCSRLGLKENAIKAAEEAIEKAEEIIIRRNRQTVAGVVISMVNGLSREHISLKYIAHAVGAGEETIRLAYKEIYPYASRLIPTWFCRVEDLRKLTPCLSN